MTATIIIVILYLLGMLLVGAWASKKIKTVEHYIIAGRDLGFWVFAILVVASTTSGMTLLGVSGLGYVGGWPTIWEQIFVPLTCAICILFYGTKLHRVSLRRGYLTLQDYFAHRYYSPRFMRGAAAIAVLVVCAIYLIGQYTAISIILGWILGIPHIYALAIAAVVVMLYVVLGGMYAVAWTTMFQGLLIVFGVVAVFPFIISSAGGLTHVNTVIGNIDPNFLRLAYPQQHPPYAPYAFATPAFLVSFALLLGLGLGAAPHIVGNIMTARKVHYFKWTPLAAFVIYLVIMYMIKIIGFAGRSMAAEGILAVDHPDNVFVAAIQHALPTAVWPFFAVIVLAAVMSTTDRLMLTVGAAFGWDIYANLVNPKASDRKITRISQVAIVVIALGTAALAISPPALLAWLIWMGIGVMLATFVAPLLAGLYWKRATRAGALAGMLSGLAASIFFGAFHRFGPAFPAEGPVRFYHYLINRPLPVHFSLYSFAVSVLVLVVVSLLTPPPPAGVIAETESGFFISDRTRGGNT